MDELSDEQVIAELINAAEAKMDAMYNSDLEMSWQEQSRRWRAATDAAERRFPGITRLLEQ